MLSIVGAPAASCGHLPFHVTYMARPIAATMNTRAAVAIFRFIYNPTCMRYETLLELYLRTYAQIDPLERRGLAT